ncbi:hypothetical protein OIU77_003954 [Salix suchowensis]|uniref:Major facilitator superfamily (MFS) profile domain-containing protein n=1 Tax=Salix suchowensis TaxID=1278906 RepID=A0ABQ9AST5_9ROSI|nr:hypothetical protein OIU77_003954 [Salix suchowensis]
MERDAMEEGLEAAASPLLLAATSSSESFKPASDPSLTPLLVFSSFVALWGSFSYGCAVGYSSPAESGIMEDLGLSVAAYSVFGSILTIGGMVGAILSGKMTDLIGRRGTMWICQVVCMAGWLAIAFAKNAWCVDIGRFVVGLAVGILTYVVPVYISEITPKNLRGRFTSVAFLAGSVVIKLACLVSNSYYSKHSAVCGFLLRSRVSKMAAGILELFQKRYAYAITVGVGLILLQALGGNSAVSYYLGTIFAKVNFSASIGPIVFSLLQIPVSIVTILLMDFFGRRTLLMASATTSCLSLLLVGYLSACRKSNI